ncbi:prepilin peptidase [Pseudohongiella sp.]|uniref:Prepilin peptidase n=1 Tax=marine sediment metagenome TaxID=412755 RepID=A0A0F9VZG2_9ZZZZ|nr:A24 family peptidase [Pseudohongiella sp.]HDZ10402.1 prepilin peptidase [Pseudohongiella sp.]HEA61975.1 prepilin peptidase [Pseudohongiella sp.]
MATLVELMQGSAALTAALAGLLGLLVGSFLNVVIYRLPLMLQREWRSQCLEYLQVDPKKVKTADPVAGHETFNLLKPDSHCPVCQKPVRPWQNIPVLSYLLLGGRCSQCQTKIHWRYPVVEILTALLSALVAWQFGATWACLAALAFTWSLVSLTVIDIDHQLLPDNITLPLLWLGLLLSVTGFGTGVTPADALLGASIGYLSLWSIYWVFKLLTGREGMGYGDFKLLAAIGAWLGWQQLLTVIILSSLTGAVIGITLAVIAGRDKNIPMSFGPYLAVAGFIALIWGDAISNTYISMLVTR